MTELQRCARTEERTIDMQHSGYSELAFLLSTDSVCHHQRTRRQIQYKGRGAVWPPLLRPVEPTIVTAH